LLQPVHYDTHRPILCTWTKENGDAGKEPDADPDEGDDEEKGDEKPS